MSFTFNGAETKKIYIAFGEKESVCLAVNDFIGDVHKICNVRFMAEFNSYAVGKCK